MSNGKKSKEQQVKEALADVAIPAIKLFDAMGEGMTVEFVLQEESTIVSPHLKTKVKSLIITKPSAKVVIVANKRG